MVMGSLSDLIESFRLASALTRTGHDLCKSFVQIPQLVYPLRNYSKADLFVIAKLNLDKNRKFVNDHVKDVQNGALLAIVSDCNPTGLKTVNDMINKSFDDCPDSDMNIARMEATLLSASYDQLAVSRDMMLAGSFFGLICRGLFYRAIVDREGSKLENPAAGKKAFRGKTQRDTLGCVISATPFIGGYIGPLRNIVKLILVLVDREGVLEALGKDMISDYNITTESINSYSLALSTWVGWGVSLSGALVDMTTQGIPRFSSTLAN